MPSNEALGVLLGMAVAMAMVLGATALWRASRRRRERRLRERFGPEYERLLQEYGDRRRVERELEARAQRVRQLHVNPLSEADRGRFADAWQWTQQQFVDTPALAVGLAHDLVQQVMRARGYPVDDLRDVDLRDVERHVADPSVDHAAVVQHYRAAQALHEANADGAPDTEQLRQALVHYRALFAALLGAAPDQRSPDSHGRWAAADA